jgi:zinc protease
MRRALAAAVALLLLAPPTAVWAQKVEPVRQTRLPNGLTVIVRENPVAPVVALSLQVRMGTRWETADTAGISNFLMAVMVKGTSKRSGAELAEAVAGLGGKISAYGEADYSEIRASALSRFWRELLGLTAELTLDPRLAPEEVDRERDWLLSRIQRRLDNAPSRAFDELFALLFLPHPYGLPILGTRASLPRIDHAAIVARYRQFFRPDSMVLTLSGQVNADEVLAEVQRLFGVMPAAGAGPAPSNPKPSPSVRRRVIEQAAQQTQILVAGLAPSLDHPDHATVKVLSTILGGGMAGRLFAELRDKRALAYTATSFYEPVGETGAIVLYLGTTPESAAQAEKALLGEVARIQRETVSDEELRRAKRFLLGRYAMDRRTNERQAWYLAFYDVERVGASYPSRYKLAVEGVTAGDVQRAAQTYLGTLTTVVLGPRPAR